MYCGTNKTALSSQNQISCTLLRLMEDVPFSRISISTLCREAGVSRQTFYSLFQSKENVITWTLQQSYCYDPDGQMDPDRSISPIEQICHSYTRYITDHADFLRLLAENNLPYILYTSMYDSLMNCCCFLPDAPEDRRAYTADFLSGGFSGLANSYILREEKPDPAVLEQLTLDILSDRLLENC